MPARVLIADDDPDVRIFLRAVLEPLFRVTEARDGAEALRLAQEATPDVVVTDLGMPGMNGVDLTLKIKEDEALRDTPVIILTGATVGEELPGGFWLKGVPADAYLEKPVDPHTLRAAVDMALKKRRGWKPLPPGLGHYEGEPDGQV